MDFLCWYIKTEDYLYSFSGSNTYFTNLNRDMYPVCLYFSDLDCIFWQILKNMAKLKKNKWQLKNSRRGCYHEKCLALIKIFHNTEQVEG